MTVLTIGTARAGALNDNEHILVAYNDTTNSLRIADVDLTNYAVAAGTANIEQMTVDVSEMVGLVGIASTSLAPNTGARWRSGEGQGIRSSYIRRLTPDHTLTIGGVLFERDRLSPGNRRSSAGTIRPGVLAALSPLVAAGPVERVVAGVYILPYGTVHGPVYRFAAHRPQLPKDALLSSNGLDGAKGEERLFANISVLICTSMIAISDGSCTDSNAIKRIQDTFQVSSPSAISNTCMHLAYERFLSFPRPRGETLAMTWSCSAKDSS